MSSSNQTCNNKKDKFTTSCTEKTDCSITTHCSNSEHPWCLDGSCQCVDTPVCYVENTYAPISGYSVVNSAYPNTLCPNECTSTNTKTGDYMSCLSGNTNPQMLSYGGGPNTSSASNYICCPSN